MQRSNNTKLKLTAMSDDLTDIILCRKMENTLEFGTAFKPVPRALKRVVPLKLSAEAYSNLEGPVVTLQRTATSRPARGVLWNHPNHPCLRAWH